MKKPRIVGRPYGLVLQIRAGRKEKRKRCDISYTLILGKIDDRFALSEYNTFKVEITLEKVKHLQTVPYFVCIVIL